MENLNAEQVKKGLECFHQRILDTHLADDIRDGEMMAILDALALINKQETEYNELYELCESYRIERDAMRGAANSYKLHCKTLEKENEGLKTLLDESYDAQNTVRADTVRKMQERLKAEMRNTARYSFGRREYSVIGEEFIDQIAKEMLEGEK